MRSLSPASSVGTSAAMYTTSQRETSLGATVEAAYQALVAVIADNTKPARCDGNPRDDTEMRHPGETADGRVHQVRSALPRESARWHPSLSPNVDAGVKAVRRFGVTPDKKIVDRQAASPSSWKTPFIASRIAW
jgi:hypothetical protein